MSTLPIGRSHRIVGPKRLLALALISASPVARAQCAAWDEVFASPGLSNNVYAVAWFDADGAGPGPNQLHAAGEFTTAGGVRAKNIARWNGATWTALGGGVSGGDTAHVTALAVFDDGAGPALYAAGAFTTAGATSASNVAKWNGTTWSAVGAGTNDWVSALAVHDDGAGPALYAGGMFTSAGGGAANYLAKWNGVQWLPVGGGTNGPVSALAVQPVSSFAGRDESGSAGVLFVGGDFSLAGTLAANNIARWSGSAWSNMGIGTNDAVLALHYVSSSAGGGPGLFAGGVFTQAGGGSASRIAKWNGVAWSPLSSGVGGGARPTCVRTILDLDDGSGPRLFVGGRFNTAGPSPAKNIARWNGSTWSPLSTGVDGMVRALGAVLNGAGPTSTLIAGGQFSSTQNTGASRIATWNGAGWSPLGAGQGLSGIVRCFALHDPDGAGSQPTRLFAGGDFKSAGNLAASSVAMWTGVAWVPVGTGTNGTVHALCVFDDGSGPALYAGGAFTSAGAVGASHVAKWNGLTWSALGLGVDDTVYALTVFDPGSGPGLYAGGVFAHAGGSAARSVARWNGASWEALGAGIDDEVRAFAVFNEGAGNNLFVGGDFTAAGGVASHNIARWNGSLWSSLGVGANGPVHALTVFDDGGGPALFAAGTFSAMNSTAADKIARWNGVTWSALGTGVIGAFAQANANLRSSAEGLFALAVFDDDGPGSNPPALFAAGEFTTANDVTTNHIAKWTGTTWSPLANGLDAAVLCLAAHDDGTTASGPALFAGGRFTHTSQSGNEKPSSRVAKWSCP